MRILVVADGYPPVDRSAPDLGCRGIVEFLRLRGHDVRILAGRPANKSAQSDGDVSRWLIREPFDITNWPEFFRKEASNQNSLRTVLGDFSPDTALFFDPWRISTSLPLLAESLGCPVCLHVSGDGLATWESDPWYREQPRGSRGGRAFRLISRRFSLAGFPHPLHELPVIFTSRYFLEATERAGRALPRAIVIPWGVDVGRFPFKENNDPNSGRLLYFGPIGPQRGIETAIEALGILKRESGHAGTMLTIGGSPPGSADDIAYLQSRAAAAGVAENVSFVDYSPDRSKPDLYLTQDLFVYPVARVEPLALPLLEAMACGLGIVAAATGGNAEVLEPEANALLIPPENPELCARAIGRLLDDPTLLKALRTRARRTIEENFRLDRSVDAIETVLADIAGQGRPTVQVISPPTARPSQASTEGGQPGQVGISPQMERSIRIGNQLVRIKHLFKPKSLAVKLRARRKRISARLCLRFFSPLFGAIHRARRWDRAVVTWPREILVVQLADLGDIVLSGPFLRNLRTFFPKSKIVLAIHPGMLNVVETCPHVDEVVPFDFRACRDWKFSFNGSFCLWRKAFGLAYRSFCRRRFDLAISLRWNDDATQAASLILMAGSGAPRRAAYLNPPEIEKLKGKATINRLITEGPFRGAAKHEIEYQKDIFRFLGGRPYEPLLEVWTSPEDERKAGELLAGSEVKPGEILVGLAPGAAWEFRRWPADRFIALGRWLQEEYAARILILAGKSEEALAGQIERGLIPGRTTNLAGRTTIREMAAVLKSCRYFVGNDSGPMHVAVAAGVTVVGLFGPGDYTRFRPWGAAHSVIRLGLTCNPCSENCLFSEARCIRGITVEQAKDAFRKMLDARIPR